MKLDFINTELRESRLFRSDSALKSKTTEDIKNTMFLYFLTLSIMGNEFSTGAWTQEYLTKTFKYGNNISSVRRSDTDLYWLMYLIHNKKTDLLNNKFEDENAVEMEKISFDKMKTLIWAKSFIKGRLTPNDTRRFLINLENTLKINVSDYKHLRRAISGWNELNDSQRSVVCTRLKFALNKYARMSEIYPEFEDFIKSKKYIMKDAIDPEISAKHNVSDILNNVGAGILVGLGFTGIVSKLTNDEDLITKYRKHYVKECTTSSSIASTVSPMFTIKRTRKTKKD